MEINFISLLPIGTSLKSLENTFSSRDYLKGSNFPRKKTISRSGEGLMLEILAS